jgi:hypothetical protein
MAVQLLDRGSQKICAWNNFGSAKFPQRGNFDGKFAANLGFLKTSIGGRWLKSHVGSSN